MQTETKAGSARLLNAVAIVTGGASGIGRSICQEFAREGAVIAILDINRDGAEETVQEIKKEGGRAVVALADATEYDQVEEAVHSATAELGNPTILVNCAGFNQMGAAEDVPAGFWEKIRAINLDGPWYCIKAVMPSMIQHRAGKILNISSGAALLAAPKAVPYIAAKAGVIGLTKSLALDLAPYGINVNAICPGTVDTPLVRKALGPEFAQRLVATIPLGRLQAPRDIARAAVFLCSSDADQITGVILPVDGGVASSMRWPIDEA